MATSWVQQMGMLAGGGEEERETRECISVVPSLRGPWGLPCPWTDGLSSWKAAPSVQLSLVSGFRKHSLSLLRALHCHLWSLALRHFGDGSFIPTSDTRLLKNFKFN